MVYFQKEYVRIFSALLQRRQKMSERIISQEISESQVEELKKLISSLNSAQSIYPFSHPLVPYLILDELDGITPLVNNGVELYVTPIEAPSYVKAWYETDITKERIFYSYFGKKPCKVMYTLASHDVFQDMKQYFQLTYNHAYRQIRCLVDGKIGLPIRCPESKKCDPECPFYVIRGKLANREAPSPYIDELISSYVPSAEDVVEKADLLNYVFSVLRKKNQKYLDIFMAHYEGYSIKELSELFGTKECTIKYALRQIRKWARQAESEYNNSH